MNKYLIMVLLSISMAACGTEVLEEKVQGRFEIIDTFKTFDNRSSEGKILKDRETGKCYIYLWGGGIYGGPAIVETEIECLNPKEN